MTDKKITFELHKITREGSIVDIEITELSKEEIEVINRALYFYQNRKPLTFWQKKGKELLKKLEKI